MIAFGVLGVLMISGEYSTGMIRSSLTAVPRRLPVLWGKLAVFAGAVFPVSLVASFVSFFLGQALLSGHHLGVSITAPGALRSVIGAALYVTVAGLIGRRPGRAAAQHRGRRSPPSRACSSSSRRWPTCCPPRSATTWPSTCPPTPGEVLWGGAHGVHHALSPWTGFALLCGYAVVLIAAAAWRLRRADA